MVNWTLKIETLGGFNFFLFHWKWNFLFYWNRLYLQHSMFRFKNVSIVQLTSVKRREWISYSNLWDAKHGYFWDMFHGTNWDNKRTHLCIILNHRWNVLVNYHFSNCRCDSWSSSLDQSTIVAKPEKGIKLKKTGHL